MPAGAYRHALLVQTDAGTTDTTTGTHSESLTDVCTRRAAVFPAGGAPSGFAAIRTLYPGATAFAEVRYDSGSIQIAPGQIVTWAAAGRTFEVTGAMDPDARRRVIHVALEERGVARTVMP